MGVIDGFWTGSTDDIYRERDQTATLSDHLNNIEDSVKGCLKWANKQYELALEYGSFSASTTDTFTDGNTYLVSVIYTNNNNALVDRSLYIMRYTTARGMVPTVTLCGCVNGNDSLLVANGTNSLAFQSQYTGTGATKCTVKII